MLPANIAAARKFVNLVTKGPRPSLKALARCLDELALSFHDTPRGEPCDEDVRPPCDLFSGYPDFADRFPDLGLYTCADLTKFPGMPMGADAIDDIRDITHDLAKVLWRFDNISEADAHWHFKFLYQIHWGDHLRHLACYLYWQIRLADRD